MNYMITVRYMFASTQRRTSFGMPATVKRTEHALFSGYSDARLWYDEMVARASVVEVEWRDLKNDRMHEHWRIQL